MDSFKIHRQRSFCRLLESQKTSSNSQNDCQRVSMMMRSRKGKSPLEMRTVDGTLKCLEAAEQARSILLSSEMEVAQEASTALLRQLMRATKEGRD